MSAIALASWKDDHLRPEWPPNFGLGRGIDGNVIPDLPPSAGLSHVEPT
jgi:hypothetical protein